MLKKYRLTDGSIYWRKFYYDMMPRFMTRYSPPLGDYNYAAYLYQPHKYIKCLYDHIKWFIQRGYRGYADCDVWSLDYYLSDWMPKALRYLEKNKRGHPIGMTMRGWQTRLRIMREGFEAAKALDDLSTKEQYQQLKRKLDRGLKLFAEHYLSLWD